LPGSIGTRELEARCSTRSNVVPPVQFVTVELPGLDAAVEVPGRLRSYRQPAPSVRLRRRREEDGHEARDVGEQLRTASFGMEGRDEGLVCETRRNRSVKKSP